MAKRVKKGGKKRRVVVYDTVDADGVYVSEVLEQERKIYRAEQSDKRHIDETESISNQPTIADVESVYFIESSNDVSAESEWGGRKEAQQNSWDELMGELYFESVKYDEGTDCLICGNPTDSLICQCLTCRDWFCSSCVMSHASTIPGIFHEFELFGDIAAKGQLQAKLESITIDISQCSGCSGCKSKPFVFINEDSARKVIVKYCSISAGLALVRLGYFPLTPKQPSIAIDSIMLSHDIIFD